MRSSWLEMLWEWLLHQCLLVRMQTEFLSAVLAVHGAVHEGFFAVAQSRRVRGFEARSWTLGFRVGV